MSREEVQNQWRELVEEFRKSGDTAAAWCREHELNPEQFRRWVRKFSNETPAKEPVAATAIQWLPVQIADAQGDDLQSMLVVHVGSAAIEVRNGFSPSLLKQVVRVLAD